MGRVLAGLFALTMVGCMLIDEGPGAGSSLIVTPPDSLVTSEGVYEPRVFTVRLATEPDSDVRLPVSVFPLEEAEVSVDELVFTPDNWDQPQEFVVTSVDDPPDSIDGTRPYQVVLSPLVSTDLGFAGIDPPDYTMVNYDADVDIKLFDPDDPEQKLKPGLLIYEQTVLPDGTFGPLGDSFGVRLTGEVREGTEVNVTFELVSAEGDASFSTVSEVHTHTVTFTPDNWDTAQLVDIVSLDDGSEDPDQISMEITVETDDPVYASKLFLPEAIAQADNEVDGITTSPLSTNLCEGDSQQVVIALNSPPIDPVEVDYVSGRSELSVAGSPVTLTDQVMSQSITLTSAENGNSESSRTADITGTVTTEDLVYIAEPASTISVTIIDDDFIAGDEEGPGQTFAQAPLQNCALNPN